MSDKKITKLKTKIYELEQLIAISLRQKTHNSAEINLPKLQRQVADLKAQLKTLES